MEEDGVTFVPGSPVTESMTASDPEDKNVVEGAWIFFEEPFYYLIFSGEVFNSPDYHVTVAR